jgi:hypothetical protein
MSGMYHVTFEEWMEPFSHWRGKEASDFIRFFFSGGDRSTIVQVGANDGVQNDPLRMYLVGHKGKVVLVEPIPHYHNKLLEMYKDKGNIVPLQCLIGEDDKSHVLYFIPPEIADMMNGDGPKNDWAHG